MAALKIRYENGGVHLPDLGLWLDPAVTQLGPEKVFISHAHSDHARAHREVILTEITAQCMHNRLRGKRVEHVMAYGSPATFAGGSIPFEITLLPAGHIFGSAMAYIEAAGQTLLYTGDFKLRAGLTAEPCAPRSADVLITETTFGRPLYQFPESSKMFEAMVKFCRDSLAQGTTPVLLAYSLGKSQELLRGLLGAGMPIMLHEQAFRLARIYQKFGCQFPPFELFEAATAAGKILLWPPLGARIGELAHVGLRRTAIFTGWAVEPRCLYRYRTDAAFPLSDHADFPELLELVSKVSPRQVLTLHGFAADFATTLRERGLEAFALSEPDQLNLPLFAAKTAIEQPANQ